MATSVTQSLFGMTPQSIQAQRAAELQQQALRFAQLTPMQQAQMGLFQAGSQLGTGLAGLMGYEDPEIAQAKARQGLLSNVDMNDPESLLSVARQAQQAGDFNTAQALVTQANEVQAKQATINKTQADLLKEQQGYQMRYEGLRSRYPNMSEEQVRSLASDVESFRKAMEGDKVLQETAEGVYLIDKNNPTNKVRIGSTVDRRSITTVDARSFNAAETAYGKAVGEDSAERDVQLLDTVEAAQTAMPKLAETRKLIESGDINTGIASNVQDVVSRARAKFLNDKAAGKNVSDSQYLDSLLGSDVFGQIAALGIGARGLDTPAEREFLREVITGTRNLDRATLLRMVDFRIDATKRAVDKYNQKLKDGEFNKYEQVTGRKLSPVSIADNTEGFKTTPSGVKYKVKGQ